MVSLHVVNTPNLRYNLIPNHAATVCSVSFRLLGCGVARR
jgi:hypothetical protein